VSGLLDAIVGLPPWLVLLLVFALPAAEAGLLVGVFVPGETAVLVGGVVAHGGSLSLWEVMVAAALGAAIGDQAGFLLGRRFGTRLVDHLPARVREAGDLDRALDLIRRRGATAVALGRWTAVMRALVPGAAGTSGMTQTRFTIANVLGGTLWAVAVAAAGFLAGASYHRLAHNLGLAGDVLVAVVIVAGLLWWARSRRRGPTHPPESPTV
jgi:membrane-associated protein